jgi:hypothetical protein
MLVAGVLATTNAAAAPHRTGAATAGSLRAKRDRA